MPASLGARRADALTRERRRRLDLLEPQQREDARGAGAARQDLEDPLELGDVAGDDLQQRVRLAGDPVGADDVGHALDDVLEARVGAVVVVGQRALDVDLQLEADRRRVEPRADAHDHAFVLEAADALERRGGGEADDSSEFHVGTVGVVLELRKQPEINIIE